MFSRKSSRQHADVCAALKDACTAAGCGCYCHEPPMEQESLLGVLGICLLAIVPLVVIIFTLTYLIEQDQAAHPPEPYVCNSITSTGSPSDCHPAVLPPDVLKKYEAQFKR